MPTSCNIHSPSKSTRSRDEPDDATAWFWPVAWANSCFAWKCRALRRPGVQTVWGVDGASVFRSVMAAVHV